MGQNAGQLAPWQLVDGERRDDHQVATAGEGVELVARQDAQDVAVRWEVVDDGDVPPQREDPAELVLGRAAGSEQRGEDEGLHRADEQHHGAARIAGGEPPERHAPDGMHREPDDEEGEQAERGDDGHRTERRDGRRLELSAPAARGHPADDTDGVDEAIFGVSGTPGAPRRAQGVDKARWIHMPTNVARASASIGEAAVAPRVGERGDRPEHADGEGLGRFVGGHEPGVLGGPHERDDVGAVHGAALAQQGGVRGVGPLDVEQGEVAGMVGVEAHARLGALAQPGQRIGIGVHRRRLRLAQSCPHRPHQLGEQLLLGREVPVEEALGDAGPPADVLDARRRVAVGGEQLGGRVDQLLLALAPVLGVSTITGGVQPPARSGSPRRSLAHAWLAHGRSPLRP